MHATDLTVYPQSQAFVPGAHPNTLGLPSRSGHLMRMSHRPVRKDVYHHEYEEEVRPGVPAGCEIVGSSE